MGWILFGITLVVAVVLFINLRQRAQADLDRLEATQRDALQQVEAEADKRVGRLEREAEKSRLGERDALVRDLLPALDSLNVAHDNLSDEEVQKGLEMVLREFHRALARHDVTEIKPDVGDPFNPHEHEAVESVDAEPEDAENGTVARCHRIGYRSGGQVLRPAMVGVFKVETVTAENDDEVVLDVGESLDSEESDEEAEAEMLVGEEVSAS